MEHNLTGTFLNSAFPCFAEASAAKNCQAHVTSWIMRRVFEPPSHGACYLLVIVLLQALIPLPGPRKRLHAFEVGKSPYWHVEVLATKDAYCRRRVCNWLLLSIEKNFHPDLNQCHRDLEESSDMIVITKNVCKLQSSVSRLASYSLLKWPLSNWVNPSAILGKIRHPQFPDQGHPSFIPSHDSFPRENKFLILVSFGIPMSSSPKAVFS